MKTIQFCGVELVNLTRDQFATFVIEESRKFGKIISFSLNGESLAKFHNDLDFKKLFLNANYVHADGMSIVTASKMLSKEGLPERIATTDWFHNVASQSRKNGESHYFLGGNEDTIQKTVANVRSQYPGIKIAGFRNGYFSEADHEKVLKEIDDAHPNFIWVGLGRPKQELFSLLIRDNCEVGIIKTCGGLFDFLAENNRRAPLIMRRLGLEWLFRLYLQPRRLFKRYLVTNYQSLKIFAKYLFKTNNLANDI
ncbi:WecB/TagA/CpsF family glycosyltransferase [Dyadobacter sp. CY323]|uniref:WecB/TagA/CpsF family glycosyltransferase n=1 Tax=Dyadobacter sp. CY323 TaxID=2907302 RepID=UPI001F21869B|nr:WecB/TagA/CpsF family glycosyltransferase [Dyadobacter sp. CY323]MCE6992747.1 WecB/TagA/CpsF family glycosyltransferase [Dyadobacter sp. CY323]